MLQLYVIDVVPPIKAVPTKLKYSSSALELQSLPRTLSPFSNSTFWNLSWGEALNTIYIREVLQCIIGGFYEAAFSTTSSKAHKESKTSCAVQTYEFNWWSSWTSKFADDLVNGQSRFWNISWSGPVEWSWGLGPLTLKARISSSTSFQSWLLWKGSKE